MKKKLFLWVATLAMAGFSACDDGVLPENDCTNGQQKCDNNNVLICSKSEWIVKTTCQSHETCHATTLACETNDSSCVDGVDRNKCVGNAWMTCDKAKWIGESCPDKTPVCSATEGCVECVIAGDCKDPEKSVCSSNKCVAVAACTEGVEPDKCEGNTWMTCVQTTWMDDACAGKTPVCSATGGCVECVIAGDCKDPEKPVCSSNKCVPVAECTEGVEADKCVDNTWMTCVETTWMKEACVGKTPVCSATEGCIKL